MSLVGIVTVTYNSEPFLKEFFDSLKAQIGADWKLFCIDNKSTDGTVQLLSGQLDPRVEVTLNPENVGVAAGNNQGIVQALAAGCEWILLLNNDVNFRQTLVSDLVAACQSNKWRVCVPKIYYERPADTLWYAGGGFNPRRGYTGYHIGKDEIDYGQHDKPRTVSYSPTCCMLIHRSVFSEVGLMDESYFVYFDDTDFCWRLRERCVAIGYWPSASLIHKVGGSTGGGSSPFSAGMTARNRLYFLRNHQGFAAALIWWPVFTMYNILRYSVRRWQPECLKASMIGSVKWLAMRPSIPSLPMIQRAPDAEQG